MEPTETNPYLQMLRVAQQQYKNSGTLNTIITETLDDYNLGGVDCEICGNKGYILRTGVNGELLTSECVCMAKRRSMRRIRKNGISDMLMRYTFKQYHDENDIQKNVKRAAIEFANADSGWFYIAGQPGSGKTHICTAICARLIERGKEVYYMKWRDESRLLKSQINSPDVEESLDKLKRIEVLYIDDFFKGGNNEADLRLAIEILNARYNNMKLRTVISTEMRLESILTLDESLGSKIYEMARDYVLEAPKENYRLR